jgi:uncharacterized protein YeaO (DUF488 family)
MQRESSGTVQRLSLADAKQESFGSQSTLTSFAGSSTGTTYIGIVNRPTDDFERVCDELDQRLAPPDGLFYQWLHERDELGHDAAFESIEYADRFERYCRTDSDASDALDDLARRIDHGESIALVCFCSDDNHCHGDVIASLL